MHFVVQPAPNTCKGQRGPVMSHNKGAHQRACDFACVLATQMAKFKMAAVSQKYHFPYNYGLLFFVPKLAHFGTNFSTN